MRIKEGGKCKKSYWWVLRGKSNLLKVEQMWEKRKIQKVRKQRLIAKERFNDGKLFKTQEEQKKKVKVVQKKA